MTAAYRTKDVPGHERLDYVRHLLANQIFPLEVEADASFDAELITGEMGAVRFTRARTGPFMCQRTKRLVRQSDPDLYSVAILTYGEFVVEDHTGTQTRLQPGDFSFFDGARPFRNHHSASKQLVTLVFPRALFPLPPAQTERAIGARLRGDHGTGALVSALGRHLPEDLDAAIGARLGATVLDLIAVAVADQTGNADPIVSGVRQRALLPRILAFVEAQLTDPDLTPATIAAAHHISTRYLYKLFENQETTVAAWIRRRRLERCRGDLLNPDLTTRSINATAIRWGFTDPAHFNRAFRTAYGLSPGRYRTTFAGPHRRTSPLHGVPAARRTHTGTANSDAAEINDTSAVSGQP